MEYYVGKGGSAESVDYNPKKDEKLADGTYKLKFKFDVEATKKNPYNVILRFQPFYNAGTGTGGRQRGEMWRIRVYSNGYYRTYDYDTMEESGKIKFGAPPKKDYPANNGLEPFFDSDDMQLEQAIREGRVKVTLESVERLPDSPAPQVVI